MPAYIGSSCIVQWVCSGGTVLINTDFRNFNYDPNVDYKEQSAGADAAKSWLAGIKSGKASLTAIMQAAGTGITTPLAEGNVGTLIVGPEGTASTKQSITIPAISDGCPYKIPYNDVVEISPSWTQNGSRVDGTF